MNTITLLNEKGGVGKTTLAINIACGLAMRGKRVVLIDGDPQGHATFGLGMPKAPKVHDWIVRDEAWENVLVEIPNERISEDTVQGKLFLLPGNIETRAVPLMINDPEVVLERVEELQGVIDVVVFDTAPTPSLFHGAIYMATDHILYPTQPSALSLNGLSDSMTHRKQASKKRKEYGLDDIKVAGVIANMFQSGYNAHDVALRWLTKNYRDVFLGTLPLRTGWQKASYAQKSVFAWNMADEASDHALRLVEKVEKVVAS